MSGRRDRISNNDKPCRDTSVPYRPLCSLYIPSPTIIITRSVGSSPQTSGTRLITPPDMISIRVKALPAAGAEQLDLVAGSGSRRATIRGCSTASATRRGLWSLSPAETLRFRRQADEQSIERIRLGCSARAVVCRTGAVGFDHVCFGKTYEIR